MNKRRRLLPDHDMTTPIQTSVTFAMDSPSSSMGLQYGRVGNRTRQSLEEKLCQIHHAKFGQVTASGSAALFLSLLLIPEHGTIFHHTELYDGTMRIMEGVVAHLGIQCASVDMHTMSEVRNACKDTPLSMIWIESPTNPSLRVLPIRELSEIAHSRGALSVVDTTMCSGLRQTPLILGADIVVESLTKAINGHDDALGGFIGTNDERLSERIRFLVQTLGPTISPFDAFLIERGLKTAAIRIRGAERTAVRVGKFLSHTKTITRVCFPGSFNPEERIIRKDQMTGRGTLISFEVSTSVDIRKFAESLQMISVCQSFGGTETTIQIPALMMDGNTADPSLVRLSVGLESARDIIDDIEQALELSLSL